MIKTNLLTWAIASSLGCVAVSHASPARADGSDLTSISSSAPSSVQSAKTPPAPEKKQKNKPTAAGEKQTVDLQGITVTGIQQSLESAMARKRYAPQISESIVAQDIGKLPDTNVADALERVTGIQITQDLGEGSTVAIRGLTQVETQLNGNTIFTSSGRGLNFEDIPASLMAGVDVYKTPTADQTEGGVGGIINLRTHRPFDFKGLEASANVGEVYANPAGRTKPKVSGLLSDTWDTEVGRLGALVAMSYESRPYKEAYSELNPTDTVTGKVDVNGDGKVDSADVLNYPPGDFYQASYGTRRRLGVNTSFQWQPSKNLMFYLDTYLADFNTHASASQMYVDSSIQTERESGLYQGTSDLLDFSLYPGTRDLKSGTFSLANVQPKTYVSNNTDKTNDLSLGEQWSSGGWSINTNLHYAKSHSHYLNDQLDLSAVAPLFTLDTSTQKPTLGYPGFDITDPSNFYYAGFENSKGRDSGTLKALRLDVAYETESGFLQTIKAGYRYADQSSTHDSFNVAYKSADTMAYFGQPGSAIPGLIKNIDYSLGSYITPDPEKIRDQQAMYDLFDLGPLPGFDPLNHYHLDERTDTAYLEGVFGTDGSIPMQGNLGVRVVRTRDDSQGSIATNGSIAPNNKNSQYTDVLPSLNLTFNLTSNLLARFAASKTITRPSFSDLAPILMLDPFTQTGTDGNPDLKPIRSTGYDASLSWYFNKSSYLFGDVFYKKVDGFTSDTSTLETYDGLGYLIVHPVNANKGQIRGAEFGYQQFFTFLPGWLKGLGFQANYTYVDSTAQGVIPDSPAPLANLSKNSSNLILIYENSSLWARVAYNWRSRFLSGTRATGIGILPIYAKGYGMLDASIGYHLTPHLSVSLEGVNLTKAHRSSYYQRETLPNELITDDRRIEADVRLNL